MADFYIIYISVTAASASLAGAWYCSRVFARMNKLSEAIYARLDEEFELEPSAPPSTEGERT